MKRAPELAVMRKAAILAGEVVEGAIKLLKPGVREIEIGAEIEYQIKKLERSGPSFETIVAFGERAALPHARPTSKRLRKNELVVLDLGAILRHYCSDITRTLRRQGSPVSRLVSRRSGSKPGRDGGVRAGTAGEVDAAARKLLRKTGSEGTSSTAQDTESDWKSTRILGWLAVRRGPGDRQRGDDGAWCICRRRRWNSHRGRCGSRGSGTEVLTRATRIHRDLIQA